MRYSTTHKQETREKLLNSSRTIAKKKGWPTSTPYTPVVGTGNEIVLETEYADLATFDRVNHAFQTDAESMKIYRRTADIVVQGSVHDEIFQEVSRPLA